MTLLQTLSFLLTYKYTQIIQFLLFVSHETPKSRIPVGRGQTRTFSSDFLGRGLQQRLGPNLVDGGARHVHYLSFSLLSCFLSPQVYSLLEVPGARLTSLRESWLRQRRRCERRRTAAAADDRDDDDCVTADDDEPTSRAYVSAMWCRYIICRPCQSLDRAAYFTYQGARTLPDRCTTPVASGERSMGV